MKRDEYKTMHRLARLAYQLPDKAKGQGRKVAREAANALLGLLYEVHGPKAGAMVWNATYWNRGYGWTDWRREARFHALKSKAA